MVSTATVPEIFLELPVARELRFPPEVIFRASVISSVARVAAAIV